MYYISPFGQLHFKKDAMRGNNGNMQNSGNSVTEIFVSVETRLNY